MWVSAKIQSIVNGYCTKSSVPGGQLQDVCEVWYLKMNKSNPMTAGGNTRARSSAAILVGKVLQGPMYLLLSTVNFNKSLSN